MADSIKSYSKIKIYTQNLKTSIQILINIHNINKC